MSLSILIRIVQRIYDKIPVLLLLQCFLSNNLLSIQTSPRRWKNKSSLNIQRNLRSISHITGPELIPEVDVKHNTYYSCIKAANSIFFNLHLIVNRNLNMITVRHEKTLIIVNQKYFIMYTSNRQSNALRGMSIRKVFDRIFWNFEIFFIMT